MMYSSVVVVVVEHVVGVTVVDVTVVDVTVVDVTVVGLVNAVEEVQMCSVSFVRY
jgi:hypothetical protein